VCWAIDLRDDKWWHGHAYIPNIWAGFTGFLIGAPVALVILAKFTTERQQNNDLARVNRMSTLAWNNFVKSFQIFYTPGRFKATTITAIEAKTAHDNAHQAVVSFITFIRIGRPEASPFRDPTDTRTATNFKRGIADTYQPLKDSVDPITIALEDPEGIETEWAALVGAWQTLDQFIRLQRLEQGLEWFDERADAELKKWLSRNPNPLSVFAGKHGYVAKHKYASYTMVDALNAIRNYNKLSEAELTAEIYSTSVRHFGHTMVNSYAEYAKEASFFLERLEHCVARVIAANWPTSEIRPR
jgi:hypothetical protein